ncbi:MAG: hypothetical protein IJS28_09370 [Synergistaceae bacterium]|nr:hypothetical protein [Synergistaceae bacterium]
MIYCALVYAFAVSVSENLHALMIASILPAILLCTRKISLPPLLKINTVNAVMLFTLALTWPVMSDGSILGLVIAWRVNMIYIVFAALVFPLGMSAVYALPLPEKMRVLVILTLRGIHILHDSIDRAFLSASLRAPDVGLMMRLKIFAYVLGASLLRSSDRSERMMRAVECRGGFGGFMQSEGKSLRVRDAMLAVISVSYSGLVVLMNYA